VEISAAMQLATEIFGTAWEFHLPTVEDILNFYEELRFPPDPYAEYLAVAATMNCPIVTADRELVRLVKNNWIEVAIFYVTEHPWAQPGALENDPPNA
jgi:hypothetical protein